MRFGLIGNPLGHSFSPRLHAAYGTPDYALCPLEPSDLTGFFAKRGFDGINVTIPYKRDVIPLVDELHFTARECGAVNTVVNRGGKLVGYNTDAFGMLFAMRHAGITLAEKHVVVLGSGGTSHTACALAKREGAASVTVVSRRGEVNYDNVCSLRDTEVIVNTTPVGMYPNSAASPVDLSVFPRLEGVFDAVFNPLRTRLIQHAEALGVNTGSGLLMLAAQAKAANILFRGGTYSEPYPDSAEGKEILAVWRGLLRDLTDIVLTGMPSSGKSTAGRLVAERLGRRFLDTDDIVTEREGMTVPELFAKRGEEGFRAAERAAVAECSAMTGAVIATGGGAPMYEVNRLNLKSNGFVVLLRRDADKLDTSGRPLSRDLPTLKRMEKERMPAYLAFADCTVYNDGTPDACAEKITEAFYENFGDQRP